MKADIAFMRVGFILIIIIAIKFSVGDKLLSLYHLLTLETFFKLAFIETLGLNMLAHTVNINQLSTHTFIKHFTLLQ